MIRISYKVHMFFFLLFLTFTSDALKLKRGRNHRKTAENRHRSIQTLSNCSQTITFEHVVYSYMSYSLLDGDGTVLDTKNFNSTEGFVNSTICYDESQCNYLLFEGYGTFNIYLDGVKTKEGDINFSECKNSMFRFGNCTFECDGYDELSIITTESYKLYNNSGLVEEKDITELTLNRQCIQNSSCDALVGNLNYLLYNNGTLVEEGSICSNVKEFGSSCVKKCEEYPLLTNTERGTDIILALSTVTEMKQLTNFNSPQYMAACWLIYDDLRYLDFSDETITQRYILAVLYFATYGRKWNLNYYFVTPENECEWNSVSGEQTRGSYCNDEGNVTMIDLGYNGLRGSIPTELSKLLSLENLILSYNEIIGTIPNELDQLLNLKKIELSNNFLSGPFIGFQKLFFNLDEVGLDSNLLSGSLPKSFGSLRKVHAHANMLTGEFPKHIGVDSNLESLDFGNNLLTGTLTILPNTFGALRNLCLSHNKLVGTIPSAIMLFLNIEVIDISYNFLTGSMPEDFHFSSVQQLNLQYNYLSGFISENLVFAPGLRKLFLNNNHFSGPFPAVLGELSMLDTLTIESNNITGSIPFQNCDQFELIRSDCAPPSKVTCNCCECNGLYTTNEVPLSCPEESEIIIDNIHIGHEFNFKLSGEEDKDYELEDGQSMPLQVSYVYPACFSATGCYIFNIYSTANLRIRFFFGKSLILEEDELPQRFNNYLHTSISFGYSSENGILLQNSCDNVTLDDIAIESKSAKRDAVNQIVRVSGVETVQNSSSQKYQALYWSLNGIGENNEIDLSASLIQRYALALFYNVTSGDKWLNNSLWLSENSECEWFGVHCDSYSNTIITKIDLGSNALKGYIPSEVGEIRGLEELKLEENNLTSNIPFAMMANLENIKIIRLFKNSLLGSIPSEIKYFENLIELDISMNELSNNLPKEFGNLGNIENLNLSNNGFCGELPKELGRATKLIRLNLRNNTFHGNVFWLRDLIHLELLWLADNFFTGDIPIGEQQKNMKTIDFSGNKLQGSLSSTIGNLKSLEELLIFNNYLTGTLPVELGMLNLVNFSLSYNEIKGTLHSEIGNMKTLKILYLHNNFISGVTDVFDYDIETYIADCGEEYLTCDTCTICCLNGGNCLTIESTWPSNRFMNSVDLPADILLVIILFVFIFGGIFLSCVILRCLFREKLPKLQNIQRDQFQSESVFKFFLSKNGKAWLVAWIAVLIQSYVLNTFIKYADYDFPYSDWAYTNICPSNSMNCDEIKSHTIGLPGWLSFFSVLAIFLIKDITDAFAIIYESITISDVKGIFAGCIVLFITLQSAIASYLFNNAAGTSEADILKDAAILLFLTDVDEQMYSFIERFFPDFLESIDNNIVAKADELGRRSSSEHGNGDLLNTFLSNESDEQHADDSSSNDEIEVISIDADESCDRKMLDGILRSMHLLETKHKKLLDRFDAYEASQDEKKDIYHNTRKKEILVHNGKHKTNQKGENEKNYVSENIRGSQNRKQDHNDDLIDLKSGCSGDSKKIKNDVIK